MLVNWKDWLSIKAWMPLKNISNPFLSHLGDTLYQLSDNFFIVAQPYDQSFVSGLPDAPFVTQLYWAASIDAAKHCVLQETQFSGFPLVPPPDEILLGTDGSYGKLAKLSDHLAERAVYDGANGEFVHKVMAVKNYSYFFLNQEIEFTQKPYAVGIMLR